MRRILLSCLALAAAAIFLPDQTMAGGNTRIKSFDEAKKILYTRIYRQPQERETIYCGFQFDDRGNVRLPRGFMTKGHRHEKRAFRVEAEHVVPAENFGRAFREWTEGSPLCVEEKGWGRGKRFAGRKCAERASARFRLMESDLHNLWPAVGAVNAWRENFDFTDMGLPIERSTFGPTCPMVIEDRLAQPTVRSRGVVARAYLYMEYAYPEVYRMSPQTRRLMTAWDSQYPPDAWECERNRRIGRVQGNTNPFIDRVCR